MKARLRKSIEIADVIVVEMGDDDVLDVRGAHAEELERIDWIAQISALALNRDFFGEAQSMTNRRSSPIASQQK